MRGTRTLVSHKKWKKRIRARSIRSTQLTRCRCPTPRSWRSLWRRRRSPCLLTSPKTFKTKMQAVALVRIKKAAVVASSGVLYSSMAWQCNHSRTKKARHPPKTIIHSRDLAPLHRWRIRVAQSRACSPKSLACTISHNHHLQLTRLQLLMRRHSQLWVREIMLIKQ